MEQFRNYDAAVGRWLTTDPYAQYHSPYVGMGNNPVSGFDPNGGWSELGVVGRWVDALLSGQNPSALRKFGNEWGFNTLSDDLTITSHFKGSMNWSQQWSNFQSGIPVWGSSRRFGNSFNRGDYVGAAGALGSTFAEAYTLGYGTLWGRAASLPMITKSTPIVDEVASGGFTLTKHGELTNGIYTVSKEAMKKHVFGGVEGKSIFYPTFNANESVLKAAQYADDAGLWISNKAKVPVLNINIGKLENGQPINVINVYRNSNGFIHGSPGTIR